MKMRPEGAFLVLTTGLIVVICALCFCDARAHSSNHNDTNGKGKAIGASSSHTWKKWKPVASRRDITKIVSTDCDFLCETKQKKNKSNMTAATEESPNNSAHNDDIIQFSPDELYKKVRSSRKECDQKHSKSFYCERVRWSWWFVKKLQANTTKLNDYVELVRRSDGDLPSTTYNDTDGAFPVTKLEKVARGLLKKWGQPADQLVFSQLRKYVTSRDLKVTIPSIGTALEFGPSSHPSGDGGETGRILFDPGFNMKMKLPFFRDELKFAVSTGPSFMAGLGIGMFMLLMKSMFSPVMMMMKAMVLSYFMRDMSPFDFLKVFGFGGSSSSNDETAEEVQQIEVYNPPMVNNQYDNNNNNYGNNQGPSAGGYIIQASQPQQHQVAPSPPSYNVINLNVVKPSPKPFMLPPSKVNPILPFVVPSQQLTAPGFPIFHSSRTPKRPSSILNSYTGSFATTGNDEGTEQQEQTLSSNSEGAFQGQVKELGSVGKSNSVESQDAGFKYVPSTALQLEVENFDPFYSPLLSRIDSIFMHLNVESEGCRERVVCSIYKSPVKYAPYSNLLSAQLSKHQSELKRPASTSPKILRYFKYMKAAKDGQGSADCVQLYPHCENDTDKLSNLPIVKTYQQLTELMGTGGTGSGQSG